ncbi:glycoside hydrolase family protein [Epilithonimonas lactis]|uniref:hypothetical protein n=1 Tax=Epilithonimonas lactis TaxID=421072 RepID=UPI0008B15D3E|nr:hypothetical protein [Epilithonimonas lactis]SEP78631.1 hypothetical protein SAMN04488097_0644 [Epilithonimonas lactis]
MLSLFKTKIGSVLLVITIVFVNCTSLPTSIKVAAKDDTQFLQNKINTLGNNGVLDGGNKTYYVTALWLKSNMTIQNMKLVSIPTSISDVSVINVGNDLETNTFNKSSVARTSIETSRNNGGFKNITIKNISIDGNRSLQKKLAVEDRDGGKHGIAVKGFATNITIVDVNIKNCATDGISLYRGLHTNLDSGKEIFAIRNVTLRNVTCTNNRRHGGSGESIDGLIMENCRFNSNGLTINGGKQEGDIGAIYNGNLYGNGWDMEGYGLGSGMRNIKISNTEFLKNMGGGIVFYDITDSRNNKFINRGNITLDNCKIDAGVKNPTGYFSLVFSSTIENKKNKTKLFSNINILNCTLYGKLLLRSVANINISNTKIIKGNERFDGLLDNVSNLMNGRADAVQSGSFSWDNYDYSKK